MNKAQILGLSFALVMVIVLAQLWRSQGKAVYSPTAAAVMAPAQSGPAGPPEFPAAEASASEPAPAPDAGANAEPSAPAVSEPAEAASPQ